MAATAPNRTGTANGSEPVADGAGLLRQDIDLTPAGGPPFSVWTRPGDVPRTIILVGHGGSRHRRAETVVMAAQAALDRVPAYVVAIEGPVQGDRLQGPADQTAPTFVGLWKTETGGVPGMVADWNAALAAVRTLEGAGDLPVGYYGVSMGTAYGIPFLVQEPRVTAASLGMWDAAFPKSERLLALAPRLQCAVRFIHRADDEHFSKAEAARLFGAIGTADKQFMVLPGPHEESQPQIDTAIDFLIERLLPAG